MLSTEKRKDLLPEYDQIPTTIHIQGQEKPEHVYLQLREAVGEVLYKDGYREVLVPLHPDFPLGSGMQLQIVDRRHRQVPASQDAQRALGESPLFSERVDPKAILRVAALGIVAEEILVVKTDNVWANFNLHTRPPMTPYTPIDAQYNELVLDLHGRRRDNTANWARPPATHGGWGIEDPGFYQDEIAKVSASLSGQGEIIPATKEEIETFKRDPRHPILEARPEDITHPDFYQHWQEHPTGMYDWDGGRRAYFYSEMMQLKKLFGKDAKSFSKKYQKLQQAALFSEPIQLQTDFEQSPFFQTNETDITLWEAVVGKRAYQLVTQRNPLVSAEAGIHMVLKLRNLSSTPPREPHTPWEDPHQTLESVAMGIGVSRLLKDTASMGEMGDAYLDMNANWSMNTRLEKFQEMDVEAVKKAIQERTRAHLHIQLEKMGAFWEMPPAPGTFPEHQMQSQATIEEIRRILGGETTGLAAFLNAHCRGDIFTEQQK